MDVESILKLTGAVLSVATLLIGVFKGVLSERFSKVGRLREEYKFAKEFFSELASSKEMHAFQKAKGYQAMAGVVWIGVDEGDYLTSLQDPARALDRYVKGYEYLQYVASSNGGPRVEFLPRCAQSHSRTWRKWLYSGGYALFGILAILPLFFGAWLVSNPSSWLLSAITSATVFGPSAALSLNALSKLVAAERLVAEQLPVIKSSGLITMSSR